MTHRSKHVEYGVDANGCATELREIDGQQICVHYDDGCRWFTIRTEDRLRTRVVAAH